MRELETASDRLAGHMMVYDRLFLVLVPLTTNGDAYVLMLVNIEVQRNFYVAQQSNFVRCYLYLGRLCDDAHGRLTTEIEGMAAMLRKALPGVDILPTKDMTGLYDPYHPCQSFWCFMHASENLRDTVTTLPPSGAELAADWPRMDVLAVDESQSHLICAEPPEDAKL